GLPLALPGQFLQSAGHRRVFKLRVQGAVEIGRDELDGQRHGSGARPRTAGPRPGRLDVNGWTHGLRAHHNRVIQKIVKSIMPAPQARYDDAMFEFSTANYDAAMAKLEALL